MYTFADEKAISERLSNLSKAIELPWSSAGKESTSIAEDPSSTPGWEDMLEKG